jgi:hypothetical protein
MEQTASTPMLENFLQADPLSDVIHGSRRETDSPIESYRESLGDWGRCHIPLIEGSLEGGNKGGTR